MLRPRSWLGLGAALLATVATARASAQSPPEPPASDAPAPPDKKAEARAHFDKGVELARQSAWPAALAEFLASKELFPTKSATINAVICLRELARYDEALVLGEAYLRDFPDLSAQEKAQGQRQLVELSGLVGTVELEGAETGAAIVIDGRDRGEFPPLGPLRVSAGSHVVRLYKQGFAPFEDRVDVAGRQTVHVTARLHTLESSGRLDVTEQAGRVLDVVVDGNIVGKTPWSGPLAPGDHTVLLRGEGDLGTQPVRVPVPAKQTTPLTLAAEQLDASLRIEPKPAGASLAIDAVTVGRGIWEGRLRAGAHNIEVAADGFVSAAQTVRLERGRRNVVTIALQRDSGSPFWRRPARPPHFVVDAAGAALIVPSFGGDVSGGCGRGCDVGPGLGFYGAVRGGYELGFGLGFGVAAGYVSAGRTTRGRATAVAPVGLDRDPSIHANAGTADDALGIRRGFLLGAWAGWTLGDRIPVHLRLGSGFLFASVTATRTGRFTASDGTSYEIAPASQEAGVTFFHLDPELRAGLRVNEHVELTFGANVLVLVPLSEPTWDERHLVAASSDGLGTFPPETLIGPALVGIAPSLGARYDF